jgi:NAD-dependent SIR2 family protein deacetylase
MLDALIDLLAGRRVVALTGAGCSTESGIPDYRGPGRAPKRPPIQYREFVTSDALRRRYWARATLGWPMMRDARPNPAHHALATLEASGAITGVITQNVDGLHGAAGSRRVVELHGALAAVRCLGCDARSSRAELHARLLAANAAWLPRAAEARAAAAPDGDAVLPDELVADFAVVACRACDGVLKPDVVFFGENVPKPTVDAAWGMFDEGEVLLVVGSSLTVFSGYRFVRRAAERGVPVAIVNQGETRGDVHAAVRLDARAGEALTALAATLRS